MYIIDATFNVPTPFARRLSNGTLERVGGVEFDYASRQLSNCCDYCPLSIA